jgi:hypothetical protein
MELLVAYQGRAILGPKFRNDMLHIAVATVAEADGRGELEFPAHRTLGPNSAVQLG